MFDCIKNLLSFSDNPTRDKIVDRTETRVALGSEKALISAKVCCSELETAIGRLTRLNELLGTELVEWNPKKHIKVQLGPKKNLNSGIPLIILFSVESGIPICAYFEEAELS